MKAFGEFLFGTFIMMTSAFVFAYAILGGF